MTTVWREESISVFRSFQKKKIDTIDDCVWGVPPFGFLYIDFPDTPDHAIATQRRLVQDFPHHSSFKLRETPEGQSKLQRLLKEINI